MGQDTLPRLKGVTFEWKDPEKEGKNAEGMQRGLIAQDVEKVFPQWVGERVDGFKSLTIQPTEIAALEVEGMRELKLQNDALQERVKSLETGRRPLVSGYGEGGIGLGLAAIAGADASASKSNPSRRSWVGVGGRAPRACWWSLRLVVLPVHAGKGAPLRNCHAWRGLPGGDWDRLQW